MTLQAAVNTGEGAEENGSLWPILALLSVLALAGGWIMLLRTTVRKLRETNAVHEKEKFAVLQFLHRMGEMVTSKTDLDTTLEIITDFIIEETGASAGAIYLTEGLGGGQFLRAHVVRGLFPPLHGATGYVLTRRKYLHDKIRAEKIPLGEGVVGHVAQSGEGLLLQDARGDSRIPPEAQELVPLESLMLMPLRVRERLVGVFVVVNKRTQGTTFTDDDMGLLRALADQAAVTVNIVQLYDEVTVKQRMESELAIAMDFQRLLLPSTVPQIPGFDVACHCSPALEMGGDYYDFMPVDDDHIGIAIADVSGKGVPGSLIMASCRSALRAEAVGNHSPAKVLRALNKRICEDTSDNTFITMTYAVLDMRTRHMSFARAGHEPTIVCSRGQRSPALYTPEGIALGLVGTEMFDVIEEKTVDLNETDLVVLYTDGVVEAMNEAGDEYGQERFHNVIQCGADGRASEFIDALLADIQDFTHGIPQHDDITIVTLRRQGEAATQPAPLRASETG
jgi:sigma-B regulation protein RsbU (phosphoserine phosphatase)